MSQPTDAGDVLASGLLSRALVGIPRAWLRVVVLLALAGPAILMLLWLVG